MYKKGEQCKRVCEIIYYNKVLDVIDINNDCFGCLIIWRSTVTLVEFLLELEYGHLIQRICTFYLTPKPHTFSKHPLASPLSEIAQMDHTAADASRQPSCAEKASQNARHSPGCLRRSVAVNRVDKQPVYDAFFSTELVYTAR